MFGSYSLWCGDHWQPVSCDPKQDVIGVHKKKMDTIDSSVCENCQHDLGDPKDLLGRIETLQLHSLQTGDDCSGRNVLQQYSRCLKCEERLVKLFDNTVSFTAKEDLLHSLR